MLRWGLLEGIHTVSIHAVIFKSIRIAVIDSKSKIDILLRSFLAFLFVATETCEYSQKCKGYYHFEYNRFINSD